MAGTQYTNFVFRQNSGSLILLLYIGYLDRANSAVCLKVLRVFTTEKTNKQLFKVFMLHCAFDIRTYYNPGVLQALVWSKLGRMNNARDE